MTGGSPAPSRAQISAAVHESGWRLVLGALHTGVRVPSLARAVDVGATVVAVAGPDADGHLWLDLRPDWVLLGLRHRASDAVTAADLALARAISTAVAGLGLVTDCRAGLPAPTRAGEPTPGQAALPTPARAGQALEIAIDALDVAAVRPFWRAVLGYTDAPGAGPTGPLVDPYQQGPALWFQQMHAPRPGRNRIHLDISVPHDEAPARIQAALAAGAVLRDATQAPSFWVLADPEGNEACVSTWQGRDG